MITEYLTVKERVEGRFSIEKSVFLYVCAPAADSRDAQNTLDSIRKQYKDATHHCYAYIADDLGNDSHFSDDGEPQGTAGVPMLEVLKANNLRHIVLCAVRWFGGKKLGTGGLTRAYARAAKEAVAASRTITKRLCAVYALSAAYDAWDKASRLLKASGAEILKTEYSAAVSAEIALPAEKAEQTVKELEEITGGSVKIIKKAAAGFF